VSEAGTSPAGVSVARAGASVAGSSRAAAALAGVSRVTSAAAGSPGTVAIGSVGGHGGGADGLPACDPVGAAPGVRSDLPDPAAAPPARSVAASPLVTIGAEAAEAGDPTASPCVVTV
jgi:hypothetical protein